MAGLTLLLSFTILAVFSPVHVAGGKCGRVKGVKHIEDVLKNPDSSTESQPWLVQVIKNNQLTCTGVLIQGSDPHASSSTNFFITADKCAEEVLESDYIQAGNSKQQVLGLKVVLGTNGQSAAVVQLSEAVPIKPVCTAENGYIDPKYKETSVRAKYVGSYGSYKVELCKLEGALFAGYHMQHPKSVCGPAGKGSPIVVYSNKLFGFKQTAFLHGLVIGVDVHQEIVYSGIPDRKSIDAAILSLTKPVPQSIEFETYSNGAKGPNGAPCFGSLVRVPVGNKYVTVALTTAKCAQIVSGNAKLYDEASTAILDFAVHQSYGNEPTSNQIGLIKLEKCGAFYSSAGGYLLPSKNTQCAGTSGFLAYGLTKVHVSTLSAPECASELSPVSCGNNIANFLCLSSPGSPAHGVPYILEGQKGIKTIVGVSVGNKHYYASVVTQLTWIQETVVGWYPELAGPEY